MRELLLKILAIVRWAAGSFIVLFGIVAAAEKGLPNIIAGLTIIILGLLLIPPIADRVKYKRIKRLKTWLAVASFVVFVAAAANSPSASQQAGSQKPTSAPAGQVIANASKAVTVSTSPTPKSTATPATALTPAHTPTPTPHALSPSASPSTSPTPRPRTPQPTPTPAAQTPSPVRPTGYRWVDNGKGGADYFSNDKPVTREKFASGAHQDVSKIEQWVFGTYASHANFRWTDNGGGGVNYYAFDSPVTREKFQTGIRAKDDNSTDVSKIEAWVAGIYYDKMHPAAAALAQPAATAPAQPAAPAQTPAPTQVPSAPVQQAPSQVYYANCTAVRAAGADPIYRGQPGYRLALDRDNDGIACEK